MTTRTLHTAIVAPLLLLLLLLFAAQPARAQQLPLGLQYTEAHPVEIVLPWDIPPYAYATRHNEPQGLLVAIIRQLFNQYHLPYHITLLPLVQLQQHIVTGQAHLTVTVRTPEPPRDLHYAAQDLVPFPIAIAHLRTVPAVRSVELLHPSDTIYTEAGSNADIYIAHYYHDATPFTYRHLPTEEAMQRLYRGEVRYYIAGQQCLYHSIRRHHQQQRAEVHNIDIPDAALAFLSADTTLLRQLDQQLLRLQAAGHYEPLLRQYLLTSPADQPDPAPLDLQKTLLLTLLILLAIAVAIVVVTLRRDTNTGNLRREYRKIANAAITLTETNVIATAIRHPWVHNLAGNFLPPDGLSYHDYAALIHPDDLLQLYQRQQDILNRRPVSDIITLRMRRHDSREWRTVLTRSYIKADPKGNPLYVYTTLDDQTENIRERQQLHEQQQQLHDITEIAGLAMVYYSPQGQHIRHNSTVLTVLTTGGATTDTAETHTNQATLQRVLIELGLGELQRHHDTWACTNLRIPELAVDIPVEYRLQTLYDNQNQHQGYTLSLIDLTEQRRQRQTNDDNQRTIQRLTRRLRTFQQELTFLRHHHTLPPQCNN